LSGRSAQLRIQSLRTIRDRVFLVQFILPKHLSYIGTMNLGANRHGEKVFMEAAVLLPAEAVDRMGYVVERPIRRWRTSWVPRASSEQAVGNDPR
jgi:hypothetical protein